LGLPAGIQKEYEAALKVRGISANAYGVLMGGFLDWFVRTEKQRGKTCMKKLTDLAGRNEIPDKLLRSLTS